MSMDYMMERALARLDPGLHGRYRNCVVVSHQMLSRYECLFPDFTDHTALHTLEILDYCNRLVGGQLSRLTAEDLYVLLMGAVFHDVGLGVSGRDFEAFLPVVCPGAPLPDSVAGRQRLVRAHHEQFSECYVQKYWELFDIPGERYAFAIAAVCRGHRKADLMDPAAYPMPCPVDGGRAVSLPYLAALLRLADEMDIAFDRNFSFLYDPEHMLHAKDRFEFKKHSSIQKVEVLPDRIAVTAATDDPEIHDGILHTVDKLRDTLFYCSEVVKSRTGYAIRQQDVELALTAL